MLWPLLVVGHAVVMAASYQGALERGQEVSWAEAAPAPPRDWLQGYDADKDLDPSDTDVLEPSKRALSVLGRWKPFSTFMRRYVAPRAHAVPAMMPDNTDFVSAETRGAIRPYGQPLRWGRR